MINPPPDRPGPPLGGIAPNPAAKQVEDRLAWLRRVRTGPVAVGLGPDQMPPTAANALEKAGLVRIDRTGETRTAHAV